MAGRSRWWTFAGRRANVWLASLAAPLRRQVSAVDDLGLALDDHATLPMLREVLDQAEVEARLRDDRTVAEVLTEPMTSTHLP